MNFSISIAVAGLIVGFAVGMTGMGGGALMTPILVLLFKIQPLAAVSSDLVASLIMKPFGAAIHVGAHTVRWSLVRLLLIGSVPSAVAGVAFLRLFGTGKTVQSVVSLALGAVVLLAVASMLTKAALDRRRGAVPSATAGDLRVKPVATILIGAVTGFIVGITSVGSGSLVVVALLFLYPRLRGSELVGTDLSQAIPMVGAAAIAHVFYGDFQLALTTSIIAGSIPGVLLGATLSSRAPSRAVRTALSVVLLVSGLKLVGVPTVALGVALAVSAIVTLAYAVFIWTAERRGGAEVSVEASA